MAMNDKESLETDKVDDVEPVQTHIERDEITNLPQEHRDYLLQRYGTLELDPIPDMSDADPYNWTTSKVRPFFNVSKVMH